MSTEPAAEERRLALVVARHRAGSGAPASIDAGAFGRRVEGWELTRALLSSVSRVPE